MAAWTHVRRTGVRKGRGNLRIFRAISSPRRAAGRLRSKSPACEGAEEDRERSPCHRDDRADGRYGLHWGFERDQVSRARHKPEIQVGERLFFVRGPVPAEAGLYGVGPGGGVDDRLEVLLANAVLVAHPMVIEVS